MPKKSPEIRILKDEVANKIAAGEVVERPASAVKELLENALDADADRIEIEFRRGGKTLLRVRDNGCGMTQEQALMSLEPHATSKIREPEDLFKISSYGFRGEAVPSIASVSQFTLRTRSEDSLDGTEIEVLGGNVKSVKACGMPRGTEVCVENLFFGVPARRKFLKSDNAEAAHILRLCRLYALLLPNVSFSLLEDSRLIFRSEAGLDLKGRIFRIFGSEISDNLVEIPKVSRGGFSVEGAISKEGVSYATNRNICVFINSRPVECRAVLSALKESYATLIPKGRYAAAFLFISMDPASVDVNVHPAKREVRLRDEFGLRNFLCEIFSNALNPRSALGTPADFSIPRPAFSPSGEIPLPPPAPREEGTLSRNERLRESFAELERAFESKSPAKVEWKRAKNFSDIPQRDFSKAETSRQEKSDSGSNAVSDWRFFGCLRRKWAVFQTPKGLTLVSISNALKRIRYEEILSSLKREGKVDSQQLIIPVNIRFDRVDAEYFEAARDSFEDCGFGIEEFGRNVYRVLSAPAWLDLSETERFIRDFVELAREEGVSITKGKLSGDLFARVAVGKSAGGGADLSGAEAFEMLGKLLSGTNHATSPDGSPIMREISDSEISKFFD